jgi:predicted alpha/beta hydrolase family esterase
MSRLLLVSGSHPSQREWIRGVEAALRDQFGEGLIFEYAHWDDPDDATVQFDTEMSRLEEIVKDGQDWILFAHSSGVFLGLRAVRQEMFRPRSAVLVGTPITENGVDLGPWIASLPGYTLYIQHKSDPIGSAADLEALLRDCQACRYDLEVVADGESHRYDAENLRRIISRHRQRLLGR